MKLILAFVFFSLMYAADPTGSLTGKVVDPSGAVVAGAKLTATSQATGLKREATSASDGGLPHSAPAFRHVHPHRGGKRFSEL